MKTCLRIVCFVLIASCIGAISAETTNAKEPAQPARRYIRIGHYQCRCLQYDFDTNLKTVLHGLKLAADTKLDIVSFPESMLTGYYQEESEARKNCFAIDSPQIKKLRAETSSLDITFMVGFNELRGEKLYNTVAVIEKGKVLGRYSKAMPCFGYFTPGREFPVFEKMGLKFGVVICADGGYIEPTRILALKGARLIFSPHYNFWDPMSGPLTHNEVVRNDHIARAVENGVYFLRGNTVADSTKVKRFSDDGHGYGDSYLLNPNGERVAAAGLYNEYLMIYNLDLKQKFYAGHSERSLKSNENLGEILQRTVESLRSR